MLKSVRQRVLSLMAAAAVLGFLGCSNELSEKSSLLLLNEIQNNKSNVQYGSIKIVSDSDSRALDVSTITSAKVTVSGYGMEDLTATNVSLSNGSGSATIGGIKVGKNRVVTVKSNIDGAVIRGVVNVEAGENNECRVNWASTAVANVYYNLIKSGTDVSNIEASDFSAAIDTTVHASLINAEAIASDYKAGSLKPDSSNYILDYGTVKVTSSKASGYTLQITDIASEKKKISSDGEAFTLEAYPGTWKAWVFNSTGAKVAEKDITVMAGEESTVDVTYTDASTFDGIQIQVAKNLGYPLIHYWDCSDKSKYPNTTWPGTEMDSTISDDDYIYNFESCSAVSLLITKQNESKLYGTDITISSKGSYRITSSGKASSTYIGSTEPKLTLTVNSAKPPVQPVKIYVSATSAPKLWVHDAGGNAISQNLLKETWPGNAMSAATDLKYNSGWYVKEIPSEYISGSTLNIHIDGGDKITTTKTTTFWYDKAGVCGTAGEYYDSDPTTVPEPVAPTLKITPATGSEIGTASSIKIDANFGNDTPSVKTVTINGTDYILKEGANIYPVSAYATEAGKTITVSGTLTNSKGTATVSATYTTKVTKEDPFTWDNVNAYFVLTDRFHNGDKDNDCSYYRKNGLNGDENVATFHGGDIKGLTEKLDYFDKLGVNAIWFTAPYEQAHGWVGGKDKKFPHYAFHGYYTLDWTSMDANMGTVEELRTFVNACHSKGIRVIMDVVMNHVGYNNNEDMFTYGYGTCKHQSHGWFEKTDGQWNANAGIEDADWKNNEAWAKWFGPWIRSFGFATGSEYGGSCGGLPDVKTELTSSVGMAPVLATKWNMDDDDVKSKYWNPSVANADWNGYSGNYRTNKEIAPADYQVVWLSAWVRELGIDGFRCDTAKHVEEFRWGQLQEACQKALEAWRTDTTKSKKYNGVDTGAAEWDENFWMTAEFFGWNKDASMALSGSYYSTGKFDSMINFQFNGSQWSGSGSSGSTPTTDNWQTYADCINKNQKDTNGNGNRNNFLSYLSSHDTGLHRPSDMKKVGTMFELLPGGIQIYYGDESNRPAAYTGCGDTDMMTRGDMNWDNTELVAHWGKVGNFRKFNPAVGAGTQSVSGSTYVRTYSGAAGNNSVAISLSSATVSGLPYSNGTTVYNWYDGKTATVSNGSATFSGSSASTSAPVLCSDRNPADYGVTF